MSSNIHVLEMPKGFLGIRIAQLVIGLIELALIAFLMARTLGAVFSAEAWAILCCIATLIIVIYNIVAARTAHSFYNMWAILSLDCALVVFWLSAMGSLAALRGAFVYPVSLNKRDYTYAIATATYLNVLSVTAAVAAVELILFIASLAMVSIRVHRYRVKNAPAAAVTLEKLENGQVQPQQPPGPYPQNGQQQQYQQQAAPQQQQQPQFQQQQQFQQQAPQQQMYNQVPPQAGFNPVSPMQQPYQPAMSPPPQQYPTPTQSPAPQYIAPQPQYPVQPPLHGVAEAPVAEYRGTA